VIIKFDVAAPANQISGGIRRAAMQESDSEGRIPIGVVWMEDDRTVVVRLRAEGPGVIGDANLVFHPSHPKYQRVLQYVGGLTVGEAKRVCEWDFQL